MRALERARRLSIERLTGKGWRRVEIDQAIDAIADRGIASAFGADPASVVSEWIREQRIAEAERVHAEATAERDTVVVGIGRRRAG